MLIREVDDELLILDTKTDRVHQLNSSASLVWRLIHQGRNEDEIAEVMTAQFDVESDRARSDVDSVIRTFRERGLVG